jgi:hypothetical protein
MRLGRIAATVTALTLAAGLAVDVWATPSGEGTATRIGEPDPGNFTHPKANPYFPLVAGTISIYRGTEEGQQLHERVRITRRTKIIQGITTVVIRDVMFADGRLDEKTSDWYQADNDGNVWYFGERTATYDENGNVSSTEGSWQAGVDGAVAGIIMPADPEPTDAYRQEFYLGHAEDQAWIVQRALNVRVPYKNVHRVVRSIEWTRLEPDVVSEKLYAPGLGMVRESIVSGGNETLELVAVRSD